ncbi:hypothetical protein EUTSA_v10009040mg [Eutrema salsugineum]|uniref:NYN domain-containing protein n=2 Tax=Eutrema salsugineum TaxID=72664 RepID=V4KF95_EUTSA|nr:hypothetical protein EUTSA_v10009040mg [Eutrema salsugineum]
MAYCADETVADGYMLDAGMTLVHKVNKHLTPMLFDICEWALDNPKGSNLLLISKFNPEEKKLVSVAVNLDRRGYNVLLATPGEVNLGWVYFTPSSVWLWTSISKGGTSINAKEKKRKFSADTDTNSEIIADTDTDSENRDESS